MLSQLFFTINFSFSILMCLVSLLVSLLMIIIIVTHRTCRTVTNLPNCNTSILVGLYSIWNIIASIYGFHEDWALNQPACTFRAFFHATICVAISYSYLIHAVSRLFFTILSKYRYLTTYPIHWCLVMFNWIFSILFSLEPLFFGGYAYETETRLCFLTSKKFSTSIYGIAGGFVMPLASSMIIYGLIFFHVLKSSRRIAASTSNTTTTTTTHAPHARREMKLARNMIILEMTFAVAGTPYLLLSLWQGIQPNRPPLESFYLLSMNAISLSIPFTMIALLFMNKQVKGIVLNCQNRQ